jgi:hypothetical protein
MVMNAGKMFAGFAYKRLHDRMQLLFFHFVIYSGARLPSIKHAAPSSSLSSAAEFPNSITLRLPLPSVSHSPTLQVRFINMSTASYARFIFAAVYLLHHGLPPDSPATFRRNALAASAQVMSRATPCACLRRVILATNR